MVAKHVAWFYLQNSFYYFILETRCTIIHWLKHCNDPWCRIIDWITFLQRSFTFQTSKNQNTTYNRIL